MSFEIFKKYVDKMNKSITDKLKGNEEELAFYTNLVKRFNDICEENAKLKERISYLERNINRKEETITELELERVPYTNQYVDKINKENENLKKQLEEMDRKLFFTKNELDMRQKSIDNKLNQQQEFIKYLEDEITKLKKVKVSSLEEITGKDYLIKIKKEILSKYKKIIGVVGVKDEIN